MKPLRPVAIGHRVIISEAALYGFPERYDLANVSVSAPRTRDSQRKKLYSAQRAARTRLGITNATDAELVELFDQLRGVHNMPCSLELHARCGGAVAYRRGPGGHPRIRLGGLRGIDTLVHEFAHVLIYSAQNAGLLGGRVPGHDHWFCQIFLFLLFRHLGYDVAHVFHEEFRDHLLRVGGDPRLLGAIIEGSYT